MPAGDRTPATHLALQVPVIVLVLAFTAIPVELAPLSRGSLASALHMRLEGADIVANIAGYVPVGMVLASRGAWPAVGVAAAVSLFAEASQVFSKGRSPSLIDVATNVIGAAIGLVVSARWAGWTIKASRTGMSRRGARLAAAMALAYASLAAWVTPRSAQEAVARLLAAPGVAWLSVNARGATDPGRLEAQWTFDTSQDDAILDASSTGPSGVLVNEPTFVDGVDGRALRLNGVNQYVDFGAPASLRLTGSMTISAWINASAFPVDDAAIVSSHGVSGYQLDTTIDRGPRTIGFKLTNASGRLMARYGRTPLEADRWYHVAGVYDARARTLNVYLNGQPNNGCLRGTVTDRQRISGVNVYVGRRGRGRGFEFAGSIDDVRIYSMALAQSEIEAEMKEARTAQSARLLVTTRESGRVPGSAGTDGACGSVEPADARTPGLIVAFGFLVAVAYVGFWPAASYRGSCLAVSFAAGFLLFPSVGSTLPPYYRLMIPVLTVVGGASVFVSVKPTCPSDEQRRAT